MPHLHKPSPWTVSLNVSRFAVGALWIALTVAPTVLVADGVPPLTEIEQHYDAVELSRGWVLRPLEDGDFQTLEILDGEIVIDGVTVDEDGLRRYVDRDADWILQLAAGQAPGSFEAETFDTPEPPPTPALDENEDEDDPRRRRRHERRHRRDSQVSVATSMVVESDETVQDIVLFSGSLDVRGEVEGDATVILGSARVSGHIDGDLVVVGGSITLEPTAEIDGEVVAVGGAVRRKPGAKVDGEITQVGVGESIHLGDFNIDIDPPDFFRPIFEFSLFDLFGRAVGLGFLTVVLLIFLFLAPNKIGRIRHRAELEPWKSGLVGLLVEILFVPLIFMVCIVLLISIVGIPLLIFVVPLMLVAMMIYLLLGFAAVCLQLGNMLGARFGRAALSPFLALAAGLFFFYLWSIIGAALSSTPFPISLVAVLLLMFGFCLKYVGWTVGLGAAVLDQMAPLPSYGSTDAERWSGHPDGAPTAPPPPAPVQGDNPD